MRYILRVNSALRVYVRCEGNTDILLVISPEIYANLDSEKTSFVSFGWRGGVLLNLNTSITNLAGLVANARVSASVYVIQHTLEAETQHPP